MGFNHSYIGSIKDLQTELNNKGLKQFIYQYTRYECLTGPSESIRFIEEKITEYEKIIDIAHYNNDRL